MLKAKQLQTNIFVADIFRLFTDQKGIFENDMVLKTEIEIWKHTFYLICFKELHKKLMILDKFKIELSKNRVKIWPQTSHGNFGLLPTT